MSKPQHPPPHTNTHTGGNKIEKTILHLSPNLRIFDWLLNLNKIYYFINVVVEAQCGPVIQSVPASPPGLTPLLGPTVLAAILDPPAPAAPFPRAILDPKANTSPAVQ